MIPILAAALALAPPLGSETPCSRKAMSYPPIVLIVSQPCRPL